MPSRVETIVSVYPRLCLSRSHLPIYNTHRLLLSGSNRKSAGDRVFKPEENTMFRVPHTCIVASLLSLLWTSWSAADEPLARTQLAKLGKAATALVEVKAGPAQGLHQGYGSAFCIHPSGLFVTNEHV